MKFLKLTISLVTGLTIFAMADNVEVSQVEASIKSPTEIVEDSPCSIDLSEESNSSFSLKDKNLQPMVEKLLQKLAIKYSLFEDSDKNLSKEPLTNEEIDSIFITFSAEKEKLEKLKKLEEALRIKLEEEKKLNDKKVVVNKSRYLNVPTGQTPVYPRDKNNPLAIGPGKSGGTTVTPIANQEQLEEFIPQEIMIPDDFYISGISCYSRVCVAYTDSKILRKGDFLFGEKILSITKNGIKIRSKKIPFN